MQLSKLYKKCSHYSIESEELFPIDIITGSTSAVNRSSTMTSICQNFSFSLQVYLITFFHISASTWLTPSIKSSFTSENF